jgi:hypothetical protein
LIGTAITGNSINTGDGENRNEKPEKFLENGRKISKIKNWIFPIIPISRIPHTRCFTWQCFTCQAASGMKLGFLYGILSIKFFKIWNYR